ncbi:kinesin-like protein KIF18A [Canis lupus baileyi]|uniref:Kinesin-like protein n=3 Tax=Canis lupus TaxID=9612 RepID=A0A8C0P1U5_CANLF|nr:kinesin-like protein KIF18A isoform X1 [Canis lupus familiaris]XP_025315604.1 kinesin-like protein KIF18A [Canis lupus dingo]XP_025315605.1 kinesin-like protein KIF18A [Canis lupus dingo]XP_038286655.1 kinesin-like protein KIF18A isoform X1 [Canis lupus familiaris]XP_038286656.1 kinesin-like protein KIF18A isoform X1 [Canis lupus familiaris]XP_038286657.1 kinesin-like protein KIF18A isoform X1 [Canis lupus familiaris]XP_038312188.1 kinesin-like protein KIF18A isoform X1 [Canis lupus famili|eukprot:XP_022263654.1 kinesin-like protein KIF18A [Canis lupus familiaris]
MSVTEEDLCHHMKVVVRVRPENTKEKATGLHKVVHVVDKHILVFDPKQEEISFFHGKKPANRDITKRQNKDLKFVFDAVFDETSTQLEVFEHTTKPILRSFLNGYNCTVLAYGATGAGKTHTMLGSAADPGVMYLTMLDLYKSMDEIKEEKVCSTAVSYLEVYNEQIRDLLVNSGPLAVREDAQKGVVVQGLTLHQPKSSEEILQLLDSGNKNRTQHPTDMNATSSRSHAVFQIYLRQQDKTASISQNVRIAKMSLIDLAGSERASATSAKGTRFIEGTNINRSLLALGNVINALADTKRKNQHIPYRNSKLTRLLKDSLGGNCQTIMIAAVSPSSMFYDDTYNTLKYANRAKDIKSSLKSNVLNLNNHITQYVKICNEQKEEILMLKEKLKAYEEQKAFTDGNNKAKIMISNPQEKEIERFQEILNCLFQNREEIRQEYLKLEMLLKENELKSFYQQQCHRQIEMMCSEDKVEKATCKRDHRLAMLKTRRFYLEKKKEEELKQFDENTNWLHRVKTEMELLGQNGHIPKELNKDLHCHHLHLQNKDLKAQIKHMMDLACLQEQQHRQTEAVLNALLPVLRKQYCALKEAGLTNTAFESDFKEIEHLVERKKVVVWADQTTEHTIKQNDLPGVSVLMTFPQLGSPVQSAPCCISSSESNLLKIPPHKRTRRKLMPSPLKAAHPQKSALSESLELNDSLSKELQPIVYTPEDCRKTAQNSSIVTSSKPLSQATRFQTISSNVNGENSLKTLCEIDTPHSRRKEYGQEDLDSTFIICEDIKNLKSKSPEQESLPNNNNILQRLASSSFSTKHPLPIPSIEPSYMAMTAAARRKRKLTSSASNTSLTAEVNPGFAKRVRQDDASEKVLQENRPTVDYKRNVHKVNPNMVRKFGRSISKGNLR